MMETLSAGAKLQRCRTAFLDNIPVPERVLLAGEGHGRFLPECVRRFPDAKIVVVDSSARMLEISKRTVKTGRVKFVHTDVLDWQAPNAAFDLVVTHFFLDCFTADELATVIGNLSRATTARAHWLVADFEIPSSGPARLRARIILALLYRFFRTTSGLRAKRLIPPDEILKNAGFSRKDRRTFNWGLLKSEWWTHERFACDGPDPGV